MPSQWAEDEKKQYCTKRFEALSLEFDWHDSIQDRLGWRSEVKMCVEYLNRQAEVKHNQCKDLWKKQRQERLELEDLALHCSLP